MATLKPAAKILIGLVIAGGVGYGGSIYLDKVDAEKAAQPTPEVVQEPQYEAPQVQVIHVQAPPAQVEEQPAAPASVETSQDAGLGALLNSGKDKK